MVFLGALLCFVKMLSNFLSLSLNLTIVFKDLVLMEPYSLTYLYLKLYGSTLLKCFITYVEVIRIELTTYCLQGSCSPS